MLLAASGMIYEGVCAFGWIQIWDLFAVKFLYDLTAACLMYFLVIMTLLFVSIGTKRTPIALRSAT